MTFKKNIYQTCGSLATKMIIVLKIAIANNLLNPFTDICEKMYL